MDFLGLRDSGFGQPPGGFFTRSAFLTASFQSPSILSISGAGPGAFLGFVFLFGIRTIGQAMQLG
jgi:hypothetical protein